MKRRSMVQVCAAGLGWLAGARAAAAKAPSPVARWLALWARPGAQGHELQARYRFTRESSLLFDPLQTEGTLALTGERLVLRGRGPDGVVSELVGNALQISGSQVVAATPGQRTPAVARPWLATRLLLLLQASDPEAVLEQTRARVPRGSRTRIDLSPAAGHPALQQVRELRLGVDAQSGELLEIAIVEAAGDVATLHLQDHQRSAGG